MNRSTGTRHLVSLQDLSDAELEELVELSLELKRGGATGSRLAGRTAGLLFFRGSLRTRTSFEAALHQLGGHSINLTAASDFWELEERDGSVMDGKAPEHIKDAAAVLSRYVDALAIRPTRGGRSWETDRRDAGIHAWASHAEVPVINMESVLWHPLQALADLMTMREARGGLAGRRLCIAWTHAPAPASSAVVNSLLTAAVRFGMHVKVAHPPGYDLDGSVLSEAAHLAQSKGAELETGLPLREGVQGAEIVYARSWGSLEHYGNPTLAASHAARASDWMVDEGLMQLGDEARLMHAMPVRRNLEVSDEVLDGERSLVYQQAENRLHSQKALLLQTLGGRRTQA